MNLKYIEGKRMSNFIEDLDDRYQKERKKNQIRKEDRAFVCSQFEIKGDVCRITNFPHITGR